MKFEKIFSQYLEKGRNNSAISKEDFVSLFKKKIVYVLAFTSQLDADVVKSNTERWTLTTKQIEGMSGNKGGGRGSSADISETIRGGASTSSTTVSTSPTPTSPPPER